MSIPVYLPISLQQDIPDYQNYIDPREYKSGFPEQEHGVLFIGLPSRNPPGHAHAPAGDDRPGERSSPSGHDTLPVPGQRRRNGDAGRVGEGGNQLLADL